MSVTCEDKKNLGLTKCPSLPTQISGMITTPRSFSLTKEDAANPAIWQAALLANKNNRIYLWPDFFASEQNSEEAVRDETSLSERQVKDGRYRWNIHISESLCLHKRMFTHSSISDRVFLIDTEGKLIGTELSNGEIAGFRVSLLNVDKLMFNDGSVVSKTPVYLSLKDNLELDERGYMTKASFISELERLTDVDLEIVSASATEVVVKVNTTCDNVPVSGFADTDFILLDGSGDPQSISGATEEDGVYTLTGTGLVTGTLNLKAPDALSIQAYESTGAVAVTIA